MPAKGADIEGGARGTRDSIGREQAAKDDARSRATKSKQADLQSYGATPAASEPSQKDISALGRAIDEYNNRTTGLGGFLNDFFGMKQKVAKNPNSGQWDVHIAKEINPTATIAGVIGGPFVGSAAQIGMKIAGIEDPLSFDIDLGWASEQGPPKENNEQRDDREFLADVKGTQNKTIANAIAKQSPIEKAVQDILNNQGKLSDFKFFDMPAFTQLDTNFGKDISTLLKEKL